MTGEDIIKLAMERRAKAGLCLVFKIKGQPDFTCYPKDEAQKAAWIASGASKGWELAK